MSTVCPLLKKLSSPSMGEAQVRVLPSTVCHPLHSTCYLIPTVCCLPFAVCYCGLLWGCSSFSAVSSLTAYSFAARAGIALTGASAR